MVLRRVPESKGRQQETRVECGKEAAKEFRFADGYKNLNHGSFGTYPIAIRSVLRQHQEDCESRPDKWIRYDFPRLLDQSRQAIADYVNAPVDACVFVPNATTGLNTVLRNIVYEPGDVIIYFSTIYGACEKTVEYIIETTPAESWKIDQFSYPSVTDDKLCSVFEEAITAIKQAGKTPKLAIYDTISSLPGVRVPFERMTDLCRKHGVISCIDGAHGIGQIPLNLSSLDPDFFFTNCHKWLYTPRGCALFYAPMRNHHLIRSTLPTSHGFNPLPQEGKEEIINPLPPSMKSDYVVNFEFVGTLDSSPYACVPACLAWRSKLTWQGKRGEDAVLSYMRDLARKGSRLVSSILGTESLEDSLPPQHCCAFSNVRLPLPYSSIAGDDFGKAIRVAQWLSQAALERHDTFVAIYIYTNAWWVRLSAQVYLTVEDFKWAGKMLDELCKEVRDGGWENALADPDWISAV